MALSIELYAPSGLTLTVDLYPYGSDTAAESDIEVTERTNAKTVYTGNLTGSFTGWHNAVIRSGSDVIGSGNVWLTGTSVVHRVGDFVGMQDPSATFVTSAQLANTAAALLDNSWGSGTTANTGLTRDRILEAVAGVIVAQLSGADTNTNEFKHLNSESLNITVIVDSVGNRSGVTIH